MITDILYTNFLQIIPANIGNICASIIILPLFSFILLGLFGKKHFNKTAGIISTLFILLATCFAFYIAYQYFFVFGKQSEIYQKIIPLQFVWLQFSQNYSINIGILLDPISTMMLLIVTFISLMVHIYSLAYMKGDERFATYFSFLGLFTFSMLGLIVASNIFQIYIFWELVGLSSFLLIGFYYFKASAVAASKKAFIVTRFADVGFLIGILILSYYAKSFDFNTIINVFTTANTSELNAAIAGHFLDISALTWGLVLIFIGGAGKSAMFPLHIWLPDAMEGPTPVSALIHAATMVVAGVFLIARLFPIFALTAQSALHIVAYIGAFSALFAAIIACTQTDIKRVLAFSTMSQIGFMMFALGVSKYGGEEGLGYTAAMFHLFTHALFKALLFLGAGSIIHFVHSNEMKDMGGLKKYLPITHVTFLIACLAISGIPPFAGFFSKEAILLAAYNNNKMVYWMALVTSGLTAFYMFRLYFNIFWNKPFKNSQIKKNDEGGWAMMLPLVLLAAGAIFAGFIHFGYFVSSDSKILENHLHLLFSIAPVLIGIVGILIAMFLYFKQNNTADKIANSFNILYKTAYHKFYIDEFYLFITKQLIFNLIAKPAAWIDKNIVDGFINSTGNSTLFVSEKIKKIQSGKVQQYSLYFLISVVVIIVWLIYFF